MKVKNNITYLIISVTILILVTVLGSSGLISIKYEETYKILKIVMYLLILLNTYFYIRLHLSIYFNTSKMYLMGILVFALSFIASGIIAVLLCIKLIIDSKRISNNNNMWHTF